MSTQGSGPPVDVNRRRTRGAAPGFQGNTYVHTNPLPAVTSLPSFSYGSPTTVLPKAPRAQDTKVSTVDALQSAANSAKARLDAEAAERKKAAERAAQLARPTSEIQRRQPSLEPTMPNSANTPKRTRDRSIDLEALSARKQSLRSGSVLSRGTSADQDSDQENRSQIDDMSDQETFNQGDATHAEIYNIINQATTIRPNMLKNRNINVGRRLSPEVAFKPRSALKGSREEVVRKPSKEKTSSNTSSARPRQSSPASRLESTYSEEFSSMGIRSRSYALTPVSETSTSENASIRVQNNIDLVISEPPLSTRDKILRLLTYRQPPPPPQHEELLETSLRSRPQLYQKTLYEWYQKLKKNIIIFGYFLKHLLSYWVLATLAVLVITSITWKYHTLAGEALTWRPTFRPPTRIPESMEELSNRMVEVEAYLKNLDDVQRAYSKDWKLETRSERNRRENLEKELVSMNSVLSKIVGVTNDFERHQKAHSLKEAGTKTVLTNIQHTLAALDKTMRVNEMNIKSSNLDSENVRKHLESFQNKIDNVKTKIERLETAQELNNKALSAFEKILPDQIAARVDPITGKLIIAPDLWRHLQSLFRNDMEEYVKASSGSSGGHAEASYAWDDWLAKNKAKLTGYIGEEHDARWRKAVADGIVVPKDHMLNIMKMEMDSLRQDMERNSKDQYRQMMTDAEKAAKAVALTAARQHSGKGAAVSKYGDAMIQAALHKYSATILQKPDFALRALGTRVIPHLTSSTYIPPRMFLGMFPIGDAAKEPVVALTESMNVGDCWSFPKSNGYISLLLAQTIFPTDVTIDHVPQGISGDARSAPKDMEFWVKISNDELREQAGRAVAVAIGEVPSSAQMKLYSAHNYIRIAAFTYDITSAYPTQTFEIPVELKQLNIPIDEVSLRILSNWGNEEYTSIYRLRVHGSAVEKILLDYTVEEKIPGL